MTHQGEERSRYQSFLLRVWRESESIPLTWRVYLSDLESGARISFPSLEAAFAFLHHELRARANMAEQDDMES